MSKCYVRRDTPSFTAINCELTENDRSATLPQFIVKFGGQDDSTEAGQEVIKKQKIVFKLYDGEVFLSILVNDLVDLAALVRRVTKVAITPKAATPARSASSMGPTHNSEDKPILMSEPLFFFYFYFL
jgi:hypothetical protein